MKAISQYKSHTSWTYLTFANYRWQPQDYCPHKQLNYANYVK